MPRALIACKLIWDSMDEFADLLESAGVEWDIPEIPGQQLAEADRDPELADLLGLRSWHSLGLVDGAEV